MTAQPLLVLTDVHKSYGGVKALQGASLDVLAGEVHALLGENGAGKSTLMKILAGVTTPDSGEVVLDGQVVTFPNAAAARQAGIGIVFQELSLFPDLDVLANLFMGREPTRFGRVDRKAMRKAAEPIARKLGLKFALDTKVANLTLAERQLVEIAKALVGNARVLILDEPNSALNGSESDRLFQLIAELKADGTAIIYISHRLEEVFELADRVSVVRGGRVVLSDLTGNLNVATAVEAMLGRKASDLVVQDAPDQSTSPVAVSLRDVDVPGRLHGVSLDVHRGEVVGLVGLEGAGQQDVLRALFGDISVAAGSMELAGESWRPSSPRDATKARIGFVPADRTRAGLMMDRTIGDNFAQVRMAIDAPLTYRNADLHRRAAARVAELRIRASSTRAPAHSLSGGNQQKIVLGKWLEVSPNLLLLDDPTRGVDVGSKGEIYALIRDLAASGVSVLFTSSEFAEYGLVCQRVLVFNSGRVTKALPGSSATEHELAAAVNASGKHV